MTEKAYTYGVARIRAKETGLLSDGDIERLMACENYEAAFLYLREKGWGNSSMQEEEKDILATEMTKTWQEVKGLTEDKSVFSVLTIPKEYHNLKATIKQVCTGDDVKGVYYEEMEFSPKELCEMVKKREFLKLPDKMAKAAEEAIEALLQTQDGQLCDIIIDRAALEEIKDVGGKSQSAFIRAYAKEVVMVANIRIAVRCAKAGKRKSFIERAMVNCEQVNVSSLADSAEKGVDNVCEYLKSVGLEEAAEAVYVSASAFERWCDNRIMDMIKSQKYNSFSVGPILAYVLARENEIKTVRIILTGKSNNLSNDFIRERIRKMYV